jgi:DNA-directed RNA polymerase specialized sigma24 family protein
MLEPSEIPRAEEAKAVSHEEIFLARYGPMRMWALRLTGGDTERAEDLVHDAFVQFTFARPDLARVQNLDGYLYQMLRNLNISQMRRAGRRRGDEPAVFEYDSAEFVLRAADPRDLIRVQDDLRQVCHYACVRKESSKAGSVLILRFMHGYYPVEIARFTGSTREAVEERLRVARHEARQYLKDPESLRFINKERGTRAASTGYVQTPEELLRDLRQRVFDSSRGECPAGEALSKIYDAKGGPDCATLAHLVSCPRCIDEVNHLHELPLLSERFPVDSLGAEPRRKDGGGDDDGGAGGGGATAEETLRCKRRAREVFEHRPRELCVSVNGRPVGAQKIGSIVNEQKLNVGAGEEVSFVEVFSEQDVRLLYLDPSQWPAESDGARTVSVGLSDRRTLLARLSYADSLPTVQVVYRDPLMAFEPAAQTAPAEEFDEQLGAANVDDSRRAGTRVRLLTHIAAAWRALLKFLGRLFNPFTVLRPGAWAAGLAVLVVAALLFTKLYVPHVSAAELLRRAAAAEESNATSKGQVQHRTVFVEEARADGRGAVSRRRVETWQGGASGIRLRRLYDEQGRLIAGEWTKSDGTSTLYRKGSAPSESGTTAPDEMLAAGEVWRIDPSAQSFKTLVAGEEGLKIDDKLGAYVVGHEAPAEGEGLRGATLWLNKSDLHAFRLTLVVRRGGETFEYRLIEGGLERKRAEEVPPAVYQLEPELLGNTVAIPVEGQGLKSQNVETAPHSTPNTQHTEVASAELEVEVAYLLNRIKANLGEQVSMGRTTGGALRVEALVESEARKEAILRALGPVLNNPAVVVEVSTVAEALARRERASVQDRLTEREVVVGAGRIPADAELRAYFAARLSDGERVDAAIKQFAARAMNHSRQALLHASALRKMVGQFTPEQARALNPDARAKWVSMVREHAGAYRHEVAALRAQLAPVFGTQGAGSEGTGGGAPRQAAERLLQLSYAQDGAVRTAFTISEGAGSAAALKSQQFWRQLSSAERLATDIEQAYEH